MAKSQEIKNVAIVGTGVIGASWAALYLARGLNVVATDPAPNAEVNLRRYIDAAWKNLTALGISPNGSRDHLRFTPDLKEAVAGANLVQENGPEREQAARNGRLQAAVSPSIQNPLSDLRDRASRLSAEAAAAGPILRHA
jgi:3-hydroxyacyl-CoA dehydrogenase